MKQLLVVLTGLAALSCSEGRERRVASSDNASAPPDLTLPDTVSRRDTSITLSSQSDGRVSPVEQQDEPRPATTTRPARSRSKPVITPKPVEAENGIRGYAPTRHTDSTVPESAPDSQPAPAQRNQADTVAIRGTDPTSADTTSTLETSAPAPNTVPIRPADSTPVLRPDTVATHQPDTTSTPAADTLVASPSRADLAARTLAIGTEIHASLNDSITSRRDTAGQIITAHVMENVRGTDGRTLIAAGTPVQFTVTRIRPARSKSSQGRLALEVNGFEIEGDLVPIEAEVRPVPRELRGRGVGGSEIAKVGGGAAAGAVLGRVIGGNTRGAVIGGVAGAAAGAVVADQTATRDVVVKAKTPVVFVLTAPLVAP